MVTNICWDIPKQFVKVTEDKRINSWLKGFIILYHLQFQNREVPAAKYWKMFCDCVDEFADKAPLNDYGLTTIIQNMSKTKGYSFSNFIGSMVLYCFPWITANEYIGEQKRYDNMSLIGWSTLGGHMVDHAISLKHQYKIDIDQVPNLLIKMTSNKSSYILW